MARRKTKKQKMKAAARKRAESGQRKPDQLSYELPDEVGSVRKKSKRKKQKDLTAERLTAVYPSIIEDTRFSVFVSIVIFIAYGALYFLL